MYPGGLSSQSNESVNSMRFLVSKHKVEDWRWLSDEEHFPFLGRTRVRFSRSSLGNSQPPATTAPWHPAPSHDLLRQLHAHLHETDTCVE